MPTSTSSTPPSATRAATAVGGSRRAPSHPDEVVIVVDVRDPRTGAPALTTNAQVGRVDAAVREAHDVVSAHGGQTIALLGTRLVATFPGPAVASAIETAIELQERATAPSSPWACTIALATGPDNNQLVSASLGIALVGGAVDRALLLAAWTAAGAVVADHQTIVTAQRQAELQAERRDAEDADPAGRPWAVGSSHVLVGHEREPIEYWDLTFPGTGAAPTSAPPEPSGGEGSAAPARARGLVVSQSAPARVRASAPTRADVRTRLDDVAARTPVSREQGRAAGGAAPPRPAGASPRPAGPPPSARPAARANRPDVRLVAEADADARRAARTDVHADGHHEVHADTRTDDRTDEPNRPVRAWSRGEVRCWFPNRGRGVIGSMTTQEFYVDRRFLAVPTPIAEGDHVFFVPRDAIGGGRNPAASAVLVVGAQVEVRVDQVDERGVGVSLLRDPAGTRAHLLLDLAGAGASVAPGDWLLVTIHAGEHGPVGRPD